MGHSSMWAFIACFFLYTSSNTLHFWFLIFLSVASVHSLLFDFLHSSTFSSFDLFHFSFFSFSFPWRLIELEMRKRWWVWGKQWWSSKWSSRHCPISWCRIHRAILRQARCLALFCNESSGWHDELRDVHNARQWESPFGAWLKRWWRCVDEDRLIHYATICQRTVRTSIASKKVVTSGAEKTYYSSWGAFLTRTRQKFRRRNRVPVSMTSFTSYQICVICDVP